MDAHSAAVESPKTPAKPFVFLEDLAVQSIEVLRMPVKLPTRDTANAGHDTRAETALQLRMSLFAG